MVLDADFAARLEAAFGPVRANGRDRFPGSNDVTVPASLARAIHTYWKRSTDDRLTEEALAELTLNNRPKTAASALLGTWQVASPRRSPTPKDDGEGSTHGYWDENVKPVSRRDIDLAKARRVEVFQKAASAFKARQGGVAGYYSEEGRNLTEKIARMEQDFRYQEFRRSNDSGKSNNSIDLHGLTVEEAMDSLAWFVDMKFDQLRHSVYATAKLEVITGKGSRGKAKIRPAVGKWLKDQGLSATETNGGGSYEVVIKKSQL